MKRMAAVVLLMAMTTPPPAGAGTVAHSLEELGRRMKPGQKVRVLERSGRLTEGVITEVSESSLTLFAGENRTVAAEEVLRVDREGDSVLNGILIGAASGAVAGVVVLVSSRSLSEEQKLADKCPECSSPSIVAIAAAEGAAVGWLIDGLRKGLDATVRGPAHPAEAGIRKRDPDRGEGPARAGRGGGLLGPAVEMGGDGAHNVRIWKSRPRAAASTR